VAWQAVDSRGPRFWDRTVRQSRRRLHFVPGRYAQSAWLWRTDALQLPRAPLYIFAAVKPGIRPWVRVICRYLVTAFAAGSLFLAGAGLDRVRRRRQERPRAELRRPRYACPTARWCSGPRRGGQCLMRAHDCNATRWQDDPFFRRFFQMRGVPSERVERSLGSGVLVDPPGCRHQQPRDRGRRPG